MKVDLSTRYLGLQLKNPLVVSACPLTGDLEKLRRLEQSGAAAAVLPSLFEETIEHDEAEIARLYHYQTNTFAESLSYFPELQRYNIGPDHYLLHLREARKAVTMPIIASLNGVSQGGWTKYARALEEAGADALELNIYFVPTDPSMSPNEIEQRYVDLVASVRKTISIPLAVKIGPFFTNVAYTARRLVEAGADGLVLFNRYLDPDIDIDELQVEPKLVLSSRHELRLPLRWIAIIQSQIDTSLAATSGIHVTQDVVKVLLAGADVAMMASVLLEHGPEFLGTLLSELEHWMRDKQYASVEQLKGSMNHGNAPDASAWERANYTKALVSFTTRPA
jgi:dihydroorotate dehydrogenase (fumarate)